MLIVTAAREHRPPRQVDARPTHQGSGSISLGEPGRPGAGNRILKVNASRVGPYRSSRHRREAPHLHQGRDRRAPTKEPDTHPQSARNIPAASPSPAYGRFDRRIRTALPRPTKATCSQERADRTSSEYRWRYRPRSAAATRSLETAQQGIDPIQRIKKRRHPRIAMRSHESTHIDLCEMPVGNRT